MERLHSIADLIVKLLVTIKNITPLLLAMIAMPGCAS